MEGLPQLAASSSGYLTLVVRMFSQGRDVYDDHDEEEDTYDDIDLDEYDIGSMAENEIL